MDTRLFPIAIILLALLLLFRMGLTKSKFGVSKLLITLTCLSIITGGIGLLTRQEWANTLVRIGLGALVILIILPPLGRLLGVSLLTKMFYRGMEEEDEID